MQQRGPDAEVVGPDEREPRVGEDPGPAGVVYHAERGVQTQPEHRGAPPHDAVRLPGLRARVAAAPLEVVAEDRELVDRPEREDQRAVGAQERPDAGGGEGVRAQHEEEDHEAAEEVQHGARLHEGQDHRQGHDGRHVREEELPEDPEGPVRLPVLVQLLREDRLLGAVPELEVLLVGAEEGVRLFYY